MSRGKLRTIVLLLGGSLTLGACAAAPQCAVALGLSLAEPANSGCMIIAGDRLLIVRDRLSGRLGLPAGRSEPPEAAQCTAHRETWEETGYRVEVGPLLAELPGRFHLYHCRLLDEPDVRDDVPRPPRAMMEIEAIHWRDPHGIPASDWRSPAQLRRILKIFDTLRAGADQ